MMKPPIEPKQEDCCNSGCNPCVFDVYEQHLRLYKKYIESGETSNLTEENAISQLEYSQFILKDKIDICSQHKLLLFKNKGTEVYKQVFWHPGEHFLVKFELEQYTCSRAYTPIKQEDLRRGHDYNFAVIVKRYSDGLVSNYLCDLQIGESSLWRGPYGHYKLDSEKYCRLIMIAQGTGIAPLFSIVKYILNDEDNETKITLLYCCKDIDTILLRDELYSLKCYWNFDYKVYLSDNQDGKPLKYKEPVSTSRLTKQDVLNLKLFPDKDQFLLCGSDDFMTQYSTILRDQMSCLNIVKF